MVRQPLSLSFSLLSLPGGDQGLLNTHWSDWSISDSSHRLPFTYNVVASLTYSYPPAFKRYNLLILSSIYHFLLSLSLSLQVS